MHKLRIIENAYGSQFKAHLDVIGSPFGINMFYKFFRCYFEFYFGGFYITIIIRIPGSRVTEFS